MTDSEGDHERAEELAATAVDFELDPDERAWLTSHLEGCSRCRLATLAYRADARSIERLPDVSAPKRVADHVANAARAGSHPKAPLSRALALLGTAAVAIVLAAFALSRLDSGLGGPGASIGPSPVASTTPAAVGSSDERPTPPSDAPSPSPPAAAQLRWQPATLPAEAVAAEIRGTTVGHGIALALLARPDERPIVWSSNDGQRWETVELQEGAFGGLPPYLIAPFADGFAALGWADASRDPSARRVWLSSDGTEWLPDPDPSGTLGRFAFGLLAGGDDLLLAGGRSGSGETNLWSSADGSVWSPLALGDAFDGAVVEDLVFQGSAFYAVGEVQGSGAIWRSDDGAAWTRLERPPDSAVIAGLVETSSGLVAYGSTQSARDVPNASWWSVNGQRWEPVTMPPLPVNEDDRIVRIATADSGLIAVWQAGPASGVRAAMSNDGRSWRFVEVQALPAGVVIEAINAIDSRIVGLGRDGRGVVVAYWSDR